MAEASGIRQRTLAAGWGVARDIGRRAGLTISRDPTLADFLRSRAVDRVIDVGANVGQFATQLRKEGYRGDIVSFEPIADVFATLSRKAARDPRWEVRRNGVGEQPARMTLNVARHSVYSSLKRPADFAVAFDEAAGTLRTEEIEVVRLDDLFADAPGLDRTFLKIDTQGFEQQVLAGASRLLAACAGVQLELPITHLYEDVWSLDAALAFMTNRGFAIAQVRGMSLMPDRASFVELDCVFRRAG